MPPKGKVQDKKTKKIVEDKTFGLKNKNKSKKVQQFINNVAATAAQTGKSHKQAKLEEAARKAKEDQKKAAAEAKKEAAELFKTVVNETKVPVGVDPKSVLCEFFKAGKCTKGAKCKYSHDMQVTLKSQKIDLYSDPRELQKDTIDTWDTDKLNEVVAKKGAGRMPPTDIVCKFFLDAIENGQYGWLWECENGPTCHYRHALPPGFVLKKKEKADSRGDEDEDEAPTIEELIEEERKKLVISKCTPMTLELFMKWKEEKKKKKEAEVEKKRKEAAKGGGGGFHALSGRDLFRYDPSLFQDDEAADDERYEIESGDEGEGGEEKEDVDKPLYDRDAQGEVDLNVDDADVGEEEEDEGKEEGEGEERKDKGKGEAKGSTAAIDADLFLDDDEEFDDDDDEEEEEEDEKKS